MFNSTENSHFRKYLATLGVSIALAALAAGGFLFKGQTDLLIEQKKLAELTPIARQAIERRQNIILFATQWSPVIVATFCIIGICISIFGLKGWANRQTSIDEREDLEKNKLAAEVRSLTLEEKEEKVEKEVQSALGAETASGKDEPESINPPLDTKTESRATIPKNKIQSFEPNDIGQVRDEIVEIERMLMSKLEVAYPRSLVISDVEVHAGTEQKYQIDALVRSNTSDLAYVIELKYVLNDTRLSRAIETGSLQAAAAAKSLNSSKSGRTTHPVVIIISNDGGESTRRRAQRINQRLELALSVPTAVLLFTQPEFASLTPEKLRSMINSKVKNF